MEKQTFDYEAFKKQGLLIAPQRRDKVNALHAPTLCRVLLPTHHPIYFTVRLRHDRIINAHCHNAFYAFLSDEVFAPLIQRFVIRLATAKHPGNPVMAKPPFYYLTQIHCPDLSTPT